MLLCDRCSLCLCVVCFLMFDVHCLWCVVDVGCLFVGARPCCWLFVVSRSLIVVRGLLRVAGCSLFASRCSLFVMCCSCGLYVVCWLPCNVVYCLFC